MATIAKHEKLSGQSDLPSPPLSPSITLRQIWQTLKEYFGDGYVEGSSPLRFRVHLCETEKPAPTDNVFYGVHIEEDDMALFNSMGATTKPSCTCKGMAAVISHIDAYLETHEIVSSTAKGAYGIYSRKDEIVPEETCMYTMRDSLQWWIHWLGGLNREAHFWLQMYVGFSTIPDDLLIPPTHLVDGTFRYLGHTVHEMFDGMKAQGVSAADCEYMYMCLLREYVVQYLEKVDDGLRRILLEKMIVMAQFRIISGNTPGCAIAILAARGIAFIGSENEKTLDIVAEMGSYGDALSLDMAKEATGILQGEPTESVAGKDRALLSAELRWLHARCNAILDAQDGGEYMKRYATSGFHFVPTMDRYLERHDLKRRKMTPQMQELLETHYRVGPSVPVLAETTSSGGKKKRLSKILNLIRG